MPRVKIDYVVSFSSEDSEHPASNLLAEEVNARRRWVCGARGEASCSVVLQLVRSARVGAVHVGSHDAALVEVLVGRSEAPDQPFQVLVLSSVFMSPAESKRGPGVSKVRTFSEQQLAADTRSQRWDRVRVVCLQPYNKHVKYGLSFIHIFEPETESNLLATTPAPALPRPPRFQIQANSSDEDDAFKPGELFAKMRNTKPQLSVDAQIRQASKPSTLKKASEFSKTVEEPHARTNKCRSNIVDERDPEHMQEPVVRDRDSLLYKDEEQPHDRIDKIIQRDRDLKEKHKFNETAIIDSRQKNKENNVTQTDKQYPRKHDDYPKHVSKNKNDSRTKHVDRTSRSDKPRENEISHGNNKHSSSYNTTDRNNSKVKHSEGKYKNRDRTESSRQDSDKKKERDRSEEPSSSKQSNKRSRSSEQHTESSHKRLKAGPRATSPHRLLADVVFVLSGYQNPRRAALRDQALAMGARYKQDWDDICTHLICAFPNTPKLRAVRSRDDNAVIVRGEWVEECCRERRRVPWQWHATEPERRQPRQELDPRERHSPLHNNECDTDDEIEKVLQKEKKAKLEPKDQRKKRATPDKLIELPSDTTQQASEPSHNTSHDSDVSFVRDERIQGNVSISDSETDSYTDEETVPAEMQDVAIDAQCSLPDFFEGYTFAVDPSVGECGFDGGLLRRYVTAYGGELVERTDGDSRADYVLAGAGRAAAAEAARAVVRPDWVWRCSDNRKKLSTKDFIIK